MAHRLEVIEGKGWELIIPKIDNICRNCGKNMMKKRLFCIENECFYCEKCIKLHQKDKVYYQNSQHEDFNIVKITLKEPDVE